MKGFRLFFGPIIIYAICGLIFWFFWDNFIKNWPVEAKIAIFVTIALVLINAGIGEIKDKLDRIQWTLDDINRNR